MILSDKIIVITGGAGLIGNVFVKAVVEQGGFAILADINSEIGEQAKQDLILETNSENIDFLQLDITNTKSLETAIHKLHEKFGKIDALVNNAYPRNKNYGKSFFDVKYDDFVENMGMNLGGYFLTSQKFAKYFRNQGYGNIVNIASVYGVVPPKFEIYNNTNMTMPVEYSTIKSGLIHLTLYMAKFFKGQNIRVNTLSPGGILDGQPSEFVDAYNQYCLNKGMLDKSDLAGSLIYLLSDMSTFVNGQNIIIDDGFTL